MRAFKMLIGLLLLPCVAAATMSLARAVTAVPERDLFWVPFSSGVVAFLIIFWALPKPMWIYVVGHELTHALWVLAFGGSVKRIRATSRGGHVIVTKSNVFISLAPYFFPLYSCAVIALYGLARLWSDWSLLSAFFYSALGLTVTFHVLMNLEVLKVRQPDWTEHGLFFSAVVVLLANLIIFGFSLSCLDGMSGARRYAAWLGGDLRSVLEWIQWASMKV